MTIKMVSQTTSASAEIRITTTLKTEQGLSTFLLDLETFLAIESVVSVIILPSVSMFGIFANVANIVVFVKMGFLETINIMFFALSVSDLVVVTNYVISTFGANGVFDAINTLFLEMPDFVFVVYPIIWAFIGFGSFTTALIAVERSVCIALPLKVKALFTPRRIVVAVLCFLAFAVASIIQKYAMMELKWVTSLATNETRLDFTYLPESVYVDHIASVSFYTVPSVIAFVVVAVGTAYMVAKLNESARWRQATAQSTNKNAVSAKEVKVIRSVALVCSVFIVCFTPNVLIGVTGLIYPPFHIADPYYGHFVYSCFLFSHMLQAVSSSVNICIYFTTSSKYKEVFMKIIVSFGKKA